MPASSSSLRPGTLLAISPEALLCSLVIKPGTFPRNRFFGLYLNPLLKRARRRAYHVRSVLKQLVDEGPNRAQILGRIELDDERVLLRYSVVGLKLQRTTAFNAIESAALNYALHQAGKMDNLPPTDRRRVEDALNSIAGAE